MRMKSFIYLTGGILTLIAAAYFGYIFGHQNRFLGTTTEKIRPDATPHPAPEKDTPHTEETAPPSHGEEEHHDSEHSLVMLPPSQVADLGIHTAIAAPGTLARELSLTGEVRLNGDRTAHVVPRLSGVVTSVCKSVADTVKANEPLMIIESRELADGKAAYLASLARLRLAEQLLQRETDLWEKKISPEQDYLRAKQACAEMRIEMQSAEQKLHALGITDRHIKDLPSQPETSLTRFEVAAPFDGTIVQKHVTQGEFLEANADCFLLADLTTVWVDANVGKSELASIKAGQTATVSAQDITTPATGVISFVAPIIGEQTRTAIARLVLPNPEGLWRPGLFVTIAVAIDSKAVNILAPKKAIVMINEQSHVFVQEDNGFSLRPVDLGITSSEQVEILRGLSPGESFVIDGAYTLKAEFEKTSMAEAGHNH